MSDRPRWNSFAGMVVGAVALVLITAIITSALAANQLPGLVDRIEKVQAQQDRQAELDAQQDRERIARSKALMHANDVMRFELRKNQNYTQILVRILRRHGFTVPEATTPPREPDPKAPAPKPSHRSPASPAPTEPSPRNPSVTDPCVVVPALCPFFQE